ncbi:hypothetical protein Mic7113_1379 [Allocoleopsis franciscana PCC 7113]|uniref:Uncharacterized protein n=1 Tax=Allocoleopsis franciscana PCC 7113 TaxID=1173027 RepID=K9WAK6_9CYAN|nr:hypothetical protein Mic7113_1379 [Allocoleopsis franciscana PCC 7113]
MATAFPIGVTIGTRFTTVEFSILVYGIIGRNDAQARITGTFHGSYGGHDGFLMHSAINITYEQVFRYTEQVILNIP